MLPHSIDRSPVAAALSWGTSTVQRGGGGGGFYGPPHTHETAFCRIMILELYGGMALSKIPFEHALCGNLLQHSNIFEVFAHYMGEQRAMIYDRASIDRCPNFYNSGF